MKLEINNLCVGYDTGVVLENLSLAVEEGEFLSLLGPSGCGKTTLMKAIAGLLPVQGRILLDGVDITRLPIHRRGTVIVFQDLRLFPHMTAAENVAFPLKMQEIPKAQRLKTAKELLAKVQMAEFGNRKPGVLSGGQQQRVALARALAAQPKLLLLDEPFSALDENLREEMRNLVLALQQEFQMTVILVTHDRGEALSMSHRVALMSQGNILQMGTPWEIYHKPLSRPVADYFGDGVYIPGRVEAGRFQGPGVSCAAGVPDGPYDLLLRPHQLDPATPGDYPVTVERIVFRGQDTQVTFHSQGDILWKKSFPHTVPWKPGDLCPATLMLEDPILFHRCGKTCG